MEGDETRGSSHHGTHNTVSPRRTLTDLSVHIVIALIFAKADEHVRGLELARLTRLIHDDSSVAGVLEDRS